MSDLQRIKPIFEQALDREGQDRCAYLDEVGRQEPELRRKVEGLLQAHDQAQGFLESPAFGAEVSPDESPLTEAPGTVIGRYQLLEKIGAGGMAVVYMAEQTEPIRRKVALKIIKLGMDTRQVIARFEAERQALALMDHPSIAKVFDAGATETGRPYFVMELVQGVSITEYCDKNSLNTKDRLHLFLQVCQAVQHAHTKGIIHRDLKPSNVMVTHHDGKPVPKVIDFGIAKATNQKLTEKTLFTRYAHLIGTPAYMSPEQAQLSDLDIDTRSDIYSLGVLLYELLTGTTPFSEEELRKAGYVEMQRVIREQEPVKPSTRIKTAPRSMGVPPMSSTGILPVIFVSRASRPRSAGRMPATRTGETPVVLMGGTPMLREVRGDLDWIVMKSLEKDRARRYETAGGLAEDIRRHLDHEPILARGPGATYRLGKFLRRHRSQVLTALVLAVAAGAAVVGFSQWSQGRRRLAEAQGLRHQAEGLRDKEALSQAREQYAKGDRHAALETIRAILDSRYVGPEARLLQAGILVDNRRSEEAVQILNSLLAEPQEIAGAAHALLARILWESGNLNTEKLKEIEAHRQKAETLLPDTAEAYFLRAMTAPTIGEQLAALDKALDLDSTHYESLRLRTFTCYASRKYARMREDALGMTYLRRRDPLGYSLRALALCELGEYGDAITEYDRAMARMGKEDLQYPDLAAQRSETLLRMGEYRRVMADAEECLKSWPDRPVFQHHLFCALTAVGDYEKADHLSRQIIRRSQEARQQFQRWCARYIFDTLHAGRSWHPADRNPVGLALLPLMEAEETYRTLSAKGRRVTTDGFSAQWSPDGKKLAFSLGVQGNSGVAIFDPATNETELLIVPGKYPRWSPDGHYLAFVRDRQFLSVPEFVAADPKNQARAGTDQEVWFMRSDGTDPRRLARGTWPSWGRDSTCVYYRSPVDITLYAISITDEAAEPRRILRCPGFVPFVSPDNTRVAYIEGTSLKVKDLISQTVVAEWPVPSPSDGWGASAWSGSGTELCLGGSGGLQTRTGLWIYRLGQSEPAQTLGGPITVGSWAPDGTKLVFEVGAPHFEIWTVDLADGVSTLEALGPARTMEQHWRELVAFHTRRIEADPLDAHAYSGRARCYDSLQERKRADADMKRWSAVMSGQSPWDLVFAAMHAPRYAIDMPFTCELVFSAERPVNTIPTMSIAFGQKGRCEMKLCEIPILSMSLVGLCLLAGLDAPPAHADFAFGTPVNLGPNINTSFGDGSPSLSPDGLTLYFSEVPFDPRPNGLGGSDLWMTTRVAQDAPWEKAVNLGPTVNTSFHDGTPSISSDGLTLYFSSTRPGGSGSWDLWMTTRATTSDPWGTPTNLGATVNSTYGEHFPSISADGLELYFGEWEAIRPGGYGNLDLWVTTRKTQEDPWGVPQNLGATVNSSFQDTSPNISPDGRMLLFWSARPGGYGLTDIWMARRRSKDDPWGTPMNVGAPVNTFAYDDVPSISWDGSTLYFSSSRQGGYGFYDIWQAPILPIVDFNGDGKVDAADMTLLVANFGKNTTLCDIGPFAWGDGVVDERDLRVLMESLLTPGPKAMDVSCDVILNWISPSFAQSCDVYLGTSREAVNNASQTNPQGVLVSQGQTASTYDPAGLLEFNQTYYWRVDFVISDPAPAIYQGPVLQFTTAGLTYPIKNITATASTMQPGSGPEKTVDGSGLDKNDGHSIDQKDMWWSTGAGPNWIQYEFDRICNLHELWVWNFNTMLEPFMGFGAKTVKIEYSTDGTAWTALADVPEFARAAGKAGYTANTIVPFGAVPARFVKLTIEKNWGVAPQTGLSEVRLFATQSPAAAQP